MILHQMHDTPPAWLGEALERFEERFSYPLGEGVRFRISHGRSYVPFFQAMGNATVWVAEREGVVLGTLAAILRTLHLPGGEERRVAYLCDLKVAPDGRAGQALAALARATAKSLRGQGVQSAYSVVMGGTSRTPSDYTGRLGIPQFSQLGELVVLKVMAPIEPPAMRDTAVVTPEEVDAAYKALNASRVGQCIGKTGGISAEAHRPGLRSLLVPVPLLEADGLACGIIEDTRRGKRLWLESGEELRAVHLSRFAYANVEAGARLVRSAITIAARAGEPAMFVAIAASDAPQFLAALGDFSVHTAAANVYGCGLPASEAWSLDTSEI